MRVDAIAHEKEQQWRLGGKHLLFQAKKENVGLQLEAAYRQSFMETFNLVCKIKILFCLISDRCQFFVFSGG